MNEIEILLVEDNEGDIVLTLEIFKELMLSNKINVVKDGEEAIRYLNKENEFVTAKTPALIFLDINLPKINGKEVLLYINSQPLLQQIPVIVLTTSSSQTDKEECYKKNAKFYIIKPLDTNSFLQGLSSLKSFSLTINAPTNTTV
jgi:CheY-like chemotaxis protein